MILKILKGLGIFVILFCAYLWWDAWAPAYKHVRHEGQWIDIRRNLQEALITVADGDTIRIPAGHYLLPSGVLMDGKSNVVIMGAGMDSTVISWRGQKEGSEGLKISHCRDIQILQMTLEDARGDIIKVSDTDGIRFSHVKVHWTDGPSTSNGAYGLYPVLCKRVLIEDCFAACASDAGVYVGQSDSVIIRRNYVTKNVAGIESENSKYVEIYDNHTYDNTGGILIFDLPGLTQYGHTTRVYNNKVVSNNHNNFAPKGNIVGMVPPGTGIMMLATRDIDIFDNEITNNRTAQTSIISYDLVLAMSPKKEKQQITTSAKAIQHNSGLDSAYNTLPDRISIFNNKYSNKHLFPTVSSDFGLLFLTKFPFATPEIVHDGFTRNKLGKFDLCTSGNDASTADLDVANEFANLTKSKETSQNCKGQVPSVTFTIPKIK